jgi:hypothetical protein
MATIVNRDRVKTAKLAAQPPLLKKTVGITKKKKVSDLASMTIVRRDCGALLRGEDWGHKARDWIFYRAQ